MCFNQCPTKLLLYILYLTFFSCNCSSHNHWYCTESVNHPAACPVIVARVSAVTAGIFHNGAMCFEREQWRDLVNITHGELSCHCL